MGNVKKIQNKHTLSLQSSFSRKHTFSLKIQVKISIYNNEFASNLECPYSFDCSYDNYCNSFSDFSGWNKWKVNFNNILLTKHNWLILLNYIRNVQERNPGLKPPSQVNGRCDVGEC